MKETRRTLEELVMRYRLHPHLCDIYVEGESDRRLVQWFLRTNNRAAVAYGISGIDVPAQAVLDKGLHDSHRGRVIFLAQYLEETLGSQVRITCIADADYDYFLQISRPEKLLLITDYTSMEMYCFNAGCVQKSVDLLGCKTNKSGADILITISALLKSMFLHRVANGLLAFELHWIDVSSCCGLVSENIEFDVTEFQKRYFNTRGLSEVQKQTFASRLTKLSNTTCTDDRRCIRGHDFVEVLEWYFGKLIRRAPRPNATEITRILFATLSADDLAAEGLFAALLGRTAGCN
jgi:hypothetical protein